MLQAKSNDYYKQKKYTEAVKVLKQMQQHPLAQRVLSYNTAQAYGKIQNEEQERKS